MKRFLLYSSIVLFSIGCSKDCPTGYGPDNCETSWASFYDGSWDGTAACNSITANGTVEMSEQTSTRILISGLYHAELDKWNHFNIEQQTFTDPITQELVVITGNGTLTHSGTQTIGSGNPTQYLTFQTWLTTDGNTEHCTFNVNR